MKNDPLYRVSYRHDPLLLSISVRIAEQRVSIQAAMNGNKPSRGARIDAEIMAEEAEMLRKKKA